MELQCYQLALLQREGVGWVGKRWNFRVALVKSVSLVKNLVVFRDSFAMTIGSIKFVAAWLSVQEVLWLHANT